MDNTKEARKGRTLRERALLLPILATGLVLGFVGTAGATPPSVDQQVIDLAGDHVPTMLLVIFGLAGATAVVALARWGVNSLFAVFNNGGKRAAK